MNNKIQKTNHGLVTTLKTAKLGTLLLLVLISSLTIGALTSVVSINGLANATTTDDTDSKIGLGFSAPTGTPIPTPTGTSNPTNPTVAPTKAPSPTPSQSNPVIPDPHDPPTTEQTPVNVGANLAKTGWVNMQTWLLAFGLLGLVFLFWAFLLVRREREGQEEDGLVVVANTGVENRDDQSVAFGSSGFGLGEDK